MAEVTTRILCTGCTGLIGRHLVPALLAEGYALRLLSRDPQRARDTFAADLPPQADIEFQAWDATADPIDATWLEEPPVAINLAGAGIADRRWTEARKSVLRRSRVESTGRVASRLAARQGGVLVNASAVGWYGARSMPVTEADAAGDGFLAELTREWEAATRPAEEAGVRVVRLRFGAILDPAGGALAEMVRPGLPLARLGSGRQPFPWLQVADAVGMIMAAVADARWQGPINAVAPQGVDHRRFMGSLARHTGKWLLPVGAPAWAMRLALGEMADEMLLSGAEVVPQRATELGYRWQHPTVDEALAACYRSAREGS